MSSIKTFSALFILLVLPGLVAAGTLDNLQATANCDGWSATLDIAFRSNTMLSRVEYAVVLTDGSGAEVERFDYADFIEIPDTPYAGFSFAAPWSTPLQDDYTVTGNFSVYDIFDSNFNMSSDSFTFALSCGNSSRGPVCLHRARYWGGNPAEWPVTSLEIAGRMYEQAELLRRLDRHSNRGLNSHLVRQMIAAKLNVANGGDGQIQATLDLADDFLAQQPDGRRARARAQREAMRYTIELFRYNSGGCDNENEGIVISGESLDFSSSADKFDDTEAVSLGSLKAMYK